MLYPIETETRSTKDLSGIWAFKADISGKGMQERWFESPLPSTIDMPVPSSYNDITQDMAIRDHIGDVWYEREFYGHDFWLNQRIFLRFGSVTHYAEVWLNGIRIGWHKGGYLPFEIEITDSIDFLGKNRLTVRANNVLDWTTLPPGYITNAQNFSSQGELKSTPQYGATELDFDDLPENYEVQEYFHDFYNYAGIHRPVKLVIRPKVHVDDITVHTDFNDEIGIIDYSVSTDGTAESIEISLLDEDGEVCATSRSAEGRLSVAKVRLWEPGNAYLYSLEVVLKDGDGNTVDLYRLPVGIRTVEVKGDQLLINGKPFYFKGFGKHEDMDIRGKAFDEALMIKDFNLLKWIGANSFRTAHYPYAEEVLQMADRLGFVVIDESPAVGLRFLSSPGPIFSDKYIGEETLKHHCDVMTEMIQRDKNHPSVVMWCVANEPATGEDGAVGYFKRVIEHTRQLDSSRPVTVVNCVRPSDCKITELIDVICVNYYFSWYTTPGKNGFIAHQLEGTLRKWHELYGKPIIMTEYGADAIAGFHQDPPAMFSEEYQSELLRRNHAVFDMLDFVIGEHVWTFSDFTTKQEHSRVLGNKKGVFTRQRQPKSVAFLLKERWGNKASFPV